jgi:polyhydroxyalkanoate synthase
MHCSADSLHPHCQAVHQVPVVIVPPCINKFYVLDLTPKKSMIRYLLEQGLDTYIISWRNPGADQAGTTFDQYLQDGLDQAFRVACALSGQPQVNAVGYCIGGAMLATWLAWSSQHYTNGDNPVASATFFATLVDYHSPGDIEVFIDPATLDWLDGKMADRLSGWQDMAMSFRMLRPNSLIWHLVVHGWLYGEKPSAFDVLYWNVDTTACRLPCIPGICASSTSTQSDQTQCADRGRPSHQSGEHQPAGVCRCRRG